MNLPGPSRSTPAAGPLGRGSPLLRDALGELALAGALLLLVASGLATLAGLGLDYPLKAGLLYGLGAWLVWRGLQAGPAPGPHPHARFGAANRLTLGRLAVGMLLAALLGEGQLGSPVAQPAAWWGIVVVATVTAVLDAADGPLARRAGLASRFGARFDMETDAWFTLLLCGLVWQAGQTGPWVLAAGLMRYAFVAAARAWPWLGGALPPSRRRQAVCVVQITALIVCLGPVVGPALATALAAASLLLLTLSFATDVALLARARHHPPAAPATPAHPPVHPTES